MHMHTITTNPCLVACLGRFPHDKYNSTRRPPLHRYFRKYRPSWDSPQLSVVVVAAAVLLSRLWDII